MARTKRRKAQVGDNVILQNPCIPDHPTMPIELDGQSSIIPSGMVGRVLEVGWWSEARVVVDLGEGRIARTVHGAIAGWIPCNPDGSVV